MKRRSFLKKSTMATAAGLVAPYILPSGRLFARTMSRKVNHVVFCLFAGGVRNIEAIHQNEGNLMPAMLEGTDSTNPGLDPLPASPWPQRLQKEGTLFPEMRYKEGPTGHFNGHTVAVTGVYTNTGLNLRTNPEAPTIFEYYLKHNSPAVTALNAWWISNSLGPYPALNYSSFPGYGPMYGANHITPAALINLETYPAIGQPKQFQFHEEEKILEVRDFLNKNFDKSIVNNSAGNYNTTEDAAQIRNFISDMFDLGLNGGFANPLGVPNNVANNDILTLFFAEKVINAFQP
ncbi:MAG: twin-arginine translocation signal domain-containing protein, partial [Bacteroidetes bacterium]|nr:twin-arginine translocation signal domain-containing protein [Bacteroidota bacterium]